MANNYLLFSAMILCADEEQRRFLTAALSDDEDPPCQVELEADGLWIYAEEFGDIDRIAEAVCSWQRKFKIVEPWQLEYAQTCSKPRLDEFGGGAVLCYRGEAWFMNSALWVLEKQREVAK